VSKPNVAIIGTPRSGSSFLSQLFVNHGWEIPVFENSIPMSSSKFNPEGYFESTNINLLNDQLIRGLYGEDFSFLFPPKFNAPEGNTIIKDFHFDLSGETVQIPDNYQDNLQLYTGEDWDVWGLTRMSAGEKWHKAYSNLGICNQIEVAKKLEQANDYLMSSQGKIVKDSRLTFTIQLFKKSIPKIVILTREKGDLETSIRNHYGQRIFTKETHEGFTWVSNHFNYKIAPMEFEEYLCRYESYYNFIESTFPDVMRVNLESLNDENVRRSILSFCGN
jgi:hypothetical protein